MWNEGISISAWLKGSQGLSGTPAKELNRHRPEARGRTRVTFMVLEDYIIAPVFNSVLTPYAEMIAIRGPLRMKIYGEGPGRRVFLPRDALRKLGITPSRLWSFIQLPLLSPVKVSELDRAALEYQERYGIASLKKAGREQGRSFSGRGPVRAVLPEDPSRAHRFLMNCFSLSIGARHHMESFKMGEYARFSYLENQFPFEPVDGKIAPGEKYFWTFMQGAMSAESCHKKQMRAEVTRKNGRVHVLSKSVEAWGNYLLDHIDEMF